MLDVLADDGLIGSAEAGWPQWRGVMRDGISKEAGLLKSWPSGGPKVVWEIGGLGDGWSCPIISGGLIYITGDVGNELVVFALDMNGELKWKAKNGRSWTRSYPGARASCVYSEGVVYQMNGHGRVVALNAKSGEELWAVNVNDRFKGKIITWATSENLLIDGERLYVTVCGEKALMAALDKHNGKTVWTTDAIAGEKNAYSSPILFEHKGRRLLANFTNPHAWVVDAENGKLQWKAVMKTRWGAAVCTPVYADGALFFVAPDGPGGSKFKLVGNPPGSKGELVWHSKIDTLMGGGLYVDGRLYTHGCKKTKTMHAVDWKSGETLLSLKRLNPRKPSHAAGALLWADGRIYGLFAGGYVGLIKPKKDELEVVGQFKLVEKTRRNDAWAHPVLLNGRLYLRYHDKLWCYDVKAK